MSSLDNIDLLYHHETQESAIKIDSPTTDLPSSLQGVTKLTETDYRTNDVEARLKMIEIKKERLKALTAMAKSQALVAEIDIAIAEYELKIELIKQQKTKNNSSRRDKNIHSRLRTSKKKPTFKNNTLGCEHPKALRNKVSHQNTESQNNVLMSEDTSLQTKSRKYPANKENYVNELKIDSIMCSIPFNKIIHLQNTSTVVKHIISTYLFQERMKDELNAESNTANTFQTESDQNAKTFNENVSVGLPIQHDRHNVETNSSVNIADDSVQQRKRVCISMLRVTHRYNFCIIPSFLTENQSGFACVEGDEVSSQKQKTQRKQLLSFNSNRLLTISSDTDYPDDCEQLTNFDTNSMVIDDTM